ncbi:dihydrofolate reductase family protein [Brevibacterium daeguense]|uniref:Dihydrofolate reductase family protein n=1 Tax=Brevibacterium daeguense TaxID=909936 RepID=A0ABP8EKF8_9MICO|nr:dihydrofolate reductase family protein [Brevibacterium daeguense]
MGKVVYGFTSSLDGFIAGPGHDMRWLEETAPPLADGTMERVTSKVGAMLSGRRGYDAAQAQADERGELTAEAYGGAWDGPQFVLTHRPEELAGDPHISALGGPVEDAIRTACEAAGDKDLMIVSADIARQALQLGLIDELQIYEAPVFLGDGTRIFGVPGGCRIDWELVSVDEENLSSAARVYRPKHRPTAQA